MKKFLIIISSLLLFNSAAFAEQNFYAGVDTNYQMLNADAYDRTGGTNKVSTSKYYKTKSLSPNIFAGFDNGESFKVELGINQNSTSKSTNETRRFSNLYINFKPVVSSTKEFQFEHKIKTTTFSLDFKPYAKINSNFLVYGIVGLSYNQIKTTESATTTEYKPYSIFGPKQNTSNSSNSATVNRVSPNIGVGFEAKFAKNFFARAQAKYTRLNTVFKFEDGSNMLKIKGATNLALGVGLYF
jgi:opacity protein-like surface antigen